MNTFKALIASLTLLAPFALSGGEESEAGSDELDFDQALEEALATKDALAEAQLMERPRLYRGPFNSSYLDSMYYHPYAFGRGYWPYGYGWYSQGIIPGRNSIWFAAGSDGYMGAGFTTTKFYPEQGITLALSASWEKGEHPWFNDLDYDAFTLSPSLQWGNENMSFFVGMDYTEMNYRGQSTRPRVVTPYINTVPETPIEPAWSAESDRLKEFNVGVRGRVNDLLDVGVSVSDGDFNRRW